MAVDYDLGTARGRIEIDSSQLGTTSQAFRNFGLGMTAMGAAAVAAFGYVVKSAADFEHQMSAVEAVSGASEAQMASLKDQALDLASTTVYSANEIGGAMEALAKAGVPVEDMMGGATEATITLAAAAGDELPGGVERAAEVISNAMKTFGAGADEMDHFADVLVGAAASSTLSVEDMATSFRYAAPIAAALGLSIDDLSTVLAILGDRGIKGSTAGTSLRGVLLSLTPSSKKASDAMKDLGLITEDGTNRFYNLDGSLKPIPEVMGILGEATKDLSEQEKVAAFNAIFQRRAMNAAMIMAESGTEGFNEYAAAIAGIDASDVAATKLDNLTGDMQILRNSVDALVIRAGQPFQDMLRGWVQALTGVVQAISELDPEVLTMIVRIVAISGVILLAIGALSLLTSWVLTAYRNFRILIAGIKLIAGAMKLLTISFLTNPVVLFIAALVALGVAIWAAYQRSEAFREAWDAAWAKVAEAIRPVWLWVQNFVSLLDDLWRAFQGGGIEGDAFSNVLEQMGLNSDTVVNALVWLRDTLIDVKNAAIDAFDYFADEILPTLVAVGLAIGGALAAAIGWLISDGIPAFVDFAMAVQDVGATIWNWIFDTAIPALVAFGTAVADIAVSVAGWFNDNVIPVFVAFGQAVAAAVIAVIAVIAFLWPAFVFAGDIIMAVLNAVWTAIQVFVDIVIIIWTYLADNVVNLVVTAWNFIVGVIEGVLSIIQGVLQVFAGIFTLNWSLVWEGIKNIFNGIWQLIYTILTTVLDLIVQAVQLAVDLVAVIWQVGWELISGIVQIVWEFILGVINGAVQFVIAIIQNVMAVLNAIWDAGWALIGSILSTAVNAITSAVVTMVVTVIGWIGSIPGSAVSALGDLLSTLYQKGVDIILGFLNGAQAQFWNVLNWALGLAGSIVDTIGDLGSTLYDIGVDLVQGFIDGIGSMASSLAGAVDDMFANIPSTIGGFLGIGSPSKYTRYFGEMLIEGLVDGLENDRHLRMALSTVGDLTTGQFALGSGTSIGSQDVIINLDLTLNGGDGDSVKAALNDETLLDSVITAVRAGRRF